MTLATTDGPVEFGTSAEAFERFLEEEEAAAAPPEPPPPPALDFSEDQVVASASIDAWLGVVGEPTESARIFSGPRDEFGVRESRTYRFGRVQTASPLLTLGGFAGTGKTTLVAHKAREWISAGLSVAFATYTGKASLVLAKAMRRFGVEPAYIGTIHRLVYQPDIGPDGAVRGWRKTDVIPYDLLVVDEASMVPSEVMTDLLSYGVPIFAVGDHGQLPPVGQDAGVMAAPDVALTRIHRQALGNPIIAISAAVRQGATFAQLEEAIGTANAAGEMRVRFLRGRKGLEEALRFTSDPQTSMLISYTNATRMSLNATARRARGLDPEGPPVKGESIICLRNNYGFGELLANGARGILEENAELRGHYYHAPVTFEDGRTLECKMLACQFGRLPFGRYEEIEKAGGPRVWSWDSVGVLCDWGYTLTCHRAQGSQAKRVVALLESAMGRMSADEQRRWLYTSCTRASDELLLVRT